MGADTEDAVIAHMGPPRLKPMPKTVEINLRQLERLIMAGDDLAGDLWRETIRTRGHTAQEPIGVINWRREQAEVTASLVNALRGCGPDA